jgi:hypothetical protein
MSYWPFIEIIQQGAGITLDDSDDVRWAKLERRAGELFGNEAPEFLPYLATLLTIPLAGESAEKIKYLDGEAWR